MFYQTFSEHDLLPMSVVSLNKKKTFNTLFSVVLYSAPLLTLHFCVSAYSDNFVEIGNPLLMIRFHAFICSRKKKQQCILLQNTSYILLVSVFYKPENEHIVSRRYHINPKSHLIKPLETQSVQYFLITFNCLSTILNYMVTGHSLIILIIIMYKSGNACNTCSISTNLSHFNSNTTLSKVLASKER